MIGRGTHTEQLRGMTELLRVQSHLLDALQVDMRSSHDCIRDIESVLTPDQRAEVQRKKQARSALERNEKAREVISKVFAGRSEKRVSMGSEGNARSCAAATAARTCEQASPGMADHSGGTKRVTLQSPPSHATEDGLGVRSSSSTNACDTSASESQQGNPCSASASESQQGSACSASASESQQGNPCSASASESQQENEGGTVSGSNATLPPAVSVPGDAFNASPKAETLSRGPSSADAQRVRSLRDASLDLFGRVERLDHERRVERLSRTTPAATTRSPRSQPSSVASTPSPTRVASVPPRNLTTPVARPHSPSVRTPTVEPQDEYSQSLADAAYHFAAYHLNELSSGESCRASCLPHSPLSPTGTRHTRSPRRSSPPSQTTLDRRSTPSLALHAFAEVPWERLQRPDQRAPSAEDP